MAPEPSLITSLSQITPVWLTSVLQRAGVLLSGSVADVNAQVGSTSFCTIARLSVTYDPAGSGPSRLFLKFSLPEHPVTTRETGAEVLFYRHIAPLTLGSLVRCFDAAFSPELARLHVLLEDLSDTHIAEPPSQLPPRADVCFGIVDAIARVHAVWWERPPWEVLGMQAPTRQTIDARIADVAARVERFMAFLDDRLSSERRATYRAVLKALPRMYERLLEPRAYTVVHDDIHIGNVLYPREPNVDSVRLVDWQTWHVDVAPKDLAHMMALFWFPERRRQLELPLLRHYHECLAANGVDSYSWDECWADYRLCVLRKLFHPPWQWETGHHANIWWNHLQRVWLAFEDLHCAELLD